MVVNPTIEPKVLEQIETADVSLDDYMAKYAAHFYEWVEGKVINMSPIYDYHDLLTRYLAMLFEAYFEVRPIGRIRQAPFVMRLPAFPNRRREPDIQIILNTNPYELTPTFMDGPADICIEVVSQESVDRDHGEKFVEYEKGGVSEYWILDRLHQECRFYRLNTEGIYTRYTEDVEGNYQTPNLPGLVIHVPTILGDVLPGPAAIVQSVAAMLK